MDENGYSKIGSQGTITATVRPHTDDFMQRRYNTSITGLKRNLYPGGAENINHHILSGEPVYGYRNTQYTDGELVFSDISGIDSRRLKKQTKNIYFAGIAKGHSEFGGNQAYGDPEVNESLTIHKAGTETIVNHGEWDIYAGDQVAWYLPDPTKKYFRPLNEPPNKRRPLLRPFDQSELYMDTSDLLEGITNKPESTSNGIGGMSLLQTLTNDTNRSKFNLRPDQEEVAGFKFGLALMLLKGIKHLVDDDKNGLTFKVAGKTFENLITTMGLFEPSAKGDKFTKNLLQAMVDDEPMSGATTDYDTYKHRAMSMWDNSRQEAHRLKTNCIIGTALSYAAPHGGSLDILIGHKKMY